MGITRTVNADKRYYLDEGDIVNVGSIVDTISIFNDMKIRLYNALYDKKYLDAGPLTAQTYSAWLKENFGTNDYYNCAVYTYASGIVSSQNELKCLYEKTMAEGLKSRDAKIGSMQHKLENKQKLKDSIRTYLKTGKWVNPYYGCRFRVSGKSILLPCGKKENVEAYERRLEDAIRKLKTRLALIREARKRAASKLEALKAHDPRRVIFGTRDLYREKDGPDTDMAAWRTGFHDARHASMSLPGRHTSRDCNFLVRRCPDGLAVKCMDGKEAVFRGFKPARYDDDWNKMLAVPKNERKAVCYNFSIRIDASGRKYIIVSVTLELENNRRNEYFGEGCVSMDINYDHVAVSELDGAGNRIGGEVFRFDPRLKTSGQVSDEIGRVMAKVGRYCADRKKPLIMEDIDTTVKKSGMKYGNPRRNAHASLFAYRKMTSCIENQSYKQGFGILKINPAYTSQMGKFLYMRKLGLSIHEAASYTIGLKGMCMTDKLMPDRRLIELLPAKTKEALASRPDIFSIMNAWKKISSAFTGIPAHSFFRGIPYDAVHNEANQKKKRKTLKMISKEMEAYSQA